MHWPWPWSSRNRLNLSKNNKGMEREVDILQDLADGNNENGTFLSLTFAGFHLYFM